MMMAPDISVIFNQPTLLKFRDYIKFSQLEIFGFYIIDSLAIELDSQHKGSNVDYTYIATYAVE
jgi:hypothetical protein